MKTGALVGGLADAIEYDVDELFADGVVTAGVVVGRVFFAWGGKEFDARLKDDSITVYSNIDAGYSPSR